MASITTTPEGATRPGEIYTRQEFLQRIGWKDAAFRTARRAGLRVSYAGGKCFVRADDWAEYLERSAAAEFPAGSAD